ALSEFRRPDICRPAARSANVNPFASRTLGRLRVPELRPGSLFPGASGDGIPHHPYPRLPAPAFACRGDACQDSPDDSRVIPDIPRSEAPGAAMKLASAEHAVPPALKEPLEAPAHFGQVDALFRNTVEHAPVGIAFANPDGGFRHCNRAFCSMLGFSVEELSRKSIASLTLSDDRESTIAGHARLWRGDIAHLDVEKRYVRKDGSALWVRVSTSLVRAGGAEPVCSVEFLRDISARKEMAAALLQNQTLLATVIAELPLALLACDVT